MDTDIKTCATCVHLRGNRNNPNYWKEWQCFKASTRINIISGLKEWELCTDLRTSKHGCDLDGKWYDQYIPPPEPEIVPTIGGKEVKEIHIDAPFTDEQLEESRKRAADRLAEIKARKKA